MIYRTIIIIIIILKLAFNLVNSKRRNNKGKKFSARHCCYLVGDSAANHFASSRTGRESCINGYIFMPEYPHWPSTPRSDL